MNIVSINSNFYNDILELRKDPTNLVIKEKVEEKLLNELSQSFQENDIEKMVRSEFILSKDINNSLENNLEIARKICEYINFRIKFSYNNLDRSSMFLNCDLDKIINCIKMKFHNEFVKSNKLKEVCKDVILLGQSCGEEGRDAKIFKLWKKLFNYMRQNRYVRLKDPERYCLAVGSKALQQQIHNCEGMTCASITVLKFVGFSSALLDVYRIINGDHCFFIIGRKKDSNPQRVEEWGECAVVCNPWKPEVFPASEFFKKMQAIKERCDDGYGIKDCNLTTDNNHTWQAKMIAFDPNIHSLEHVLTVNCELKT